MRIRDFGRVVTGTTPPSSKREQFGDLYPFITPSDLGFDTKSPRTERRLSSLGAAANQRRELPPGSVAFTCIGATIGKCCFISETSFSNQQINTIVVDKSKFSPDYVYYLLRHEAESIKSQASGAATPIISKSAFENIAVTSPVPSLAMQRRIGEILSAYDELIENNTRRIKILEEMAQSIYKEWFVNFRYPGHENVPLVDSELGPIPEGWRAAPLGELLSVDKGLSYKGAHLTDVGVPMANLKCFGPDGGFRRSGTKPYSGEYKDRHHIEPGDLVIANTDLTQAGGVIGAPARIPHRGFEGGGIATHHLFIVRRLPESPGTSFLFHSVAAPSFRSYARGRASGTTVLGFKAADVLGYTFPLPDPHLIGRFEGLANPIASQIETLQDSIEVLRETRDLLLPRLVSGEIEVSSWGVPSE